MKSKTLKDFFIPITISIICAIIIIYSIETKKNFLHIFIGFLLYFFPFAFISVFNTRMRLSLIIFITFVLFYLLLKHKLYAFFIGIILAALTGLPLYFYRVKPFKPFSVEKYKKSVERYKESLNRKGDLNA